MASLTPRPSIGSPRRVPPPRVDSYLSQELVAPRPLQYPANNVLGTASPSTPPSRSDSPVYYLDPGTPILHLPPISHPTPHIEGTTTGIVEEVRRSSESPHVDENPRKSPSPSTLGRETPPKTGAAHDSVSSFEIIQSDSASPPPIDFVHLAPKSKLRRSTYWARRRKGVSVDQTNYSFLAPQRNGRGQQERKRNHLIPGFERPRYKVLIVHTILCALITPTLLVCVIIARHKSLFWARFVVSLGSTLLGVAIAASLLRMARRIIEAATWSTIIHQSRIEGNPGVRLKDLAAHTHNPTSIWPALRLLWDRNAYPGADRAVRNGYDHHPWSLYLILFVFVILLSLLLPFVFGRIVFIETWTMHQNSTFREVTVAGQLTDSELVSMGNMWPMFENPALAWTLAPSESPSTVSFQRDNDTIYFPEVTKSQLFGNDSSLNGDVNSNVMGVSSTLRALRWGVRTRCSEVGDPTSSIVTKSISNHSYVFVGRDVLQNLFTGFSLPLPATLEKTANFSQVAGGDLLPAGLDLLQTSLMSKFPDNRESYSLNSIVIDSDPGWQGFATIETVLVRLNTTFAQQGNFSRFGSDVVPDKDGFPTRIGYDAAVCVLIHEPWIVEVNYITDGLGAGGLATTNISDTGTVTQNDSSSRAEEVVGEILDDIPQGLDVDKLRPAFMVAYQNAVNRLVRENNRGGEYFTSSTLLSFTDGQGPFGYTSFSPARYAQTRAVADATNTLPYLIGTGFQIARQYPDHQLTTSSLDPIWLGVVVPALFVIGLVLAFFVPSLPEPIPRRGFDFYSWFVAMQTGELVASSFARGMHRKMDLDDPAIVDELGDLRLRYIEWVI